MGTYRSVHLGPYIEFPIVTKIIDVPTNACATPKCPDVGKEKKTPFCPSCGNKVSSVAKKTKQVTRFWDLVAEPNGLYEEIEDRFNQRHNEADTVTYLLSNCVNSVGAEDNEMKEITTAEVIRLTSAFEKEHANDIAEIERYLERAIEVKFGLITYW